MSNSFDREELANYYDEYEICRYCKKNGADAFHHIFSRSGRFTNSILNAIPLHNYTCHINIHGKLMTREQQEKFITQNLEYLHRKGYKLKKLDWDFIMEYNLLELIKKVII